MPTTANSLYDSDFYGWTQRQADALRNKHISALDFDNLLEEIEAMGRGEKRELKSRLVILLMHLIKWQHQPARKGKSWSLTIRNQREDIRELLAENPSLKPRIDATMSSAWKKALRETEEETGMDISDFPQQCPWSFDDIMKDDFWPQ